MDQFLCGVALGCGVVGWLFHDIELALLGVSFSLILVGYIINEIRKENPE